MRRQPASPAGEVRRFYLNSKVLANNLLNDPIERMVDVYIPAGCDGKGLPLLVDIVGFTGGGPAHTSWKNFQENVPERLDRLIAANEMPPCIVAFPDCFTKLGGNQYINSEAMGHWADFLLQEAVPFVEEKFKCGGIGKRGVFGKSSGGYGAIVHALLYPDFWSAAACHSGDMGFELMFLHEFPAVLRELAKTENSAKKWLENFFVAKKVKDKDTHILMMLAMAASFDPDPSSPYGIRLPVDLHTCELISERWKKWMAWDPLVLLEKHSAGLKKMKALYIDCGDIDQFNLLYGARRMHRELERLNIPHIYEEFPDDHSAIDYRMDRSLPVLAKALSA